GSPGPRAIGAREVPADLARPGGPPFDRNGDAGDGEHLVGEVADGRLVPAADVQDFPAAFALRCRDDRATEGVDVEEIARLGPVAVDHERLAREDALEEHGDDAALQVRVRTVDVGEAQRDGGDAVRAVVGRAVALARELARPVRGQRMRRHALVYGRDGVPEDRAAGGCRDEPLEAAAPTKPAPPVTSQLTGREGQGPRRVRPPEVPHPWWRPSRTWPHRVGCASRASRRGAG